MLGLSASSNFDLASATGTNKTGGASISGGGAHNLLSIIASVQNDIKSLRTQLDNIPAFPKGTVNLQKKLTSLD